MSLWGGNTNDESKPQFRWLLKSRGNKIANVFATAKGWVMRWPWGDEVLVGIGGLNTNLGAPTMSAIRFLAPTTGYVVNAAAQALSLLVNFNEGVAVTGTPTLVATANGASANVTLSYSADDSDPTAGKLVFKNASVNAAADTVGDGYTVNSSSVLSGWAGIKDIVSETAVTNAVGAFSASVEIKQQRPVNSDTEPSGEAGNTANVYVAFLLTFNQPVEVLTVPTIVAIGDAVANANVSLYYTSVGSNLAAGELMFKSDVQDFSALTVNAVFTVNSTSVTTGFAGIVNDIDGAAANTIAVANTFTVVAAAE